MVKYVASKGNLALFTNGDRAVVIDTELGLVLETSELTKHRTRGWYDQTETSDEIQALAASALFEEPITAAGSRMYTIKLVLKKFVTLLNTFLVTK